MNIILFNYPRLIAFTVAITGHLFIVAALLLSCISSYNTISLKTFQGGGASIRLMTPTTTHHHKAASHLSDQTSHFSTSPRALTKKKTTPKLRAQNNKIAKTTAQKTQSPGAKKPSTKVQSSTVKKEYTPKKAVQKPQIVKKSASPIKQTQEKKSVLQKISQRETTVSVQPPLTHQIDIPHACTPAGDSTDNNTITHTLQQKWCPPKDIAPRAICVIKVEVGQGTVSSVPQVVESSGTPAFDTQARLFLQQMTYPRSVWNSELIIRFL